MRLFKLVLLLTGLLALSGRSAQAAVINLPAGLSAGVIPTLTGGYNANYVFAGAVDGTAIYLWIPAVGAFDPYVFDELAGDWIPFEPTFVPGQGYWAYSPVAQTFTPTLRAYGGAGGAPVPALPPLTADRYSFQGSPTGLPATYEDIFGAPPNNETALLRFIPGSASIDRGTDNYRFYYYKEGVWTPETPMLNPLEPAFVIYPYLSIKYTMSGNPLMITMTWPARGKLEEAEFPNGPWSEVTTAGNTHSVTPPSGQSGARYYRVKE
jgi:hypothetical protein